MTWCGEMAQLRGDVEVRSRGGHGAGQNRRAEEPRCESLKARGHVGA